MPLPMPFRSPLSLLGIRCAILAATMVVGLPPNANADARPARPSGIYLPRLPDGRPILPAWETGWEHRLRRQKTDQQAWLQSFRDDHPELYGVTTPPLQPVHHYAEFDPVDAIYYAWEPGTFDTFFAGLTHELITRTGVTVYLLHHGAEERATLETLIAAEGDDPADASFIDVSTLGPYYTWQTEWPFDRSLESFWTVDFGPFFVQDGAGRLGIQDPRYYFFRINDDAIPSKLAALQGLTVWRPDLDWEGGNLFSDGQGTCFTSYMHLAENLPQTQQQIENQLFQYFGCEKVIWLWPLHGEGTGHIDMFFKNASPTVLLVGQYDPADDPVNAERLDQNAALLASETNAAGAPFEVFRFPMPSHSGDIWRTYANGIVVNDLVLVPTYAQTRTHESEALTAIGAAFAGRTVVGLDADAIIEWGGAIHCVTRTRPVATLEPTGETPGDACGGASLCTPGCGAITNTGLCEHGDPVYCDGGEPVVESCYSDERCGWDLQGDYFYCVPQGCTGLAARGECRTSDDGITAAVWCEDGFPVGEACPAAADCGYDATLGRMACTGGCLDECAAGEGGCEPNGDAWRCDEANDGDDCLERIVTPCPAGAPCESGACGCLDECAAGEGGCDATGIPWHCDEAGDGDDCLEPVADPPCESGRSCNGGHCKTPDSGCGCHAAGAGWGGAGGWGPLLALALVALLWIRRGRSRLAPDAPVDPTVDPEALP